MTLVAIRAMAAADLTAAVEVVRAHSADDGRLAERYFRRYCADPERVASPREGNLVATVDGTLVGVVSYGPDKYDWADLLWLNRLYVHRAARRRGIGSRLLQEVVERARALQIRKLYLDTDFPAPCEAALRLYQRFGFQEEGGLLDYYRPGEHRLVMGLRL
ncbi:MAG: GNAT family N-acetyltransferase [Candidatus Latescibacterota bacterium]